jgi:competence protein ComEC
MKRAILALAASACLAAPALAQNRAAKPLTIYVIDVEGGNATLFVSPSGESLLMDTGNAGAVAAPRDAGRIMEAVHDAGLTQIDNLIITHWHGDHFGGLQELAKQIPIKHYWDHGPNVQPGQAADDFLKNVYADLISKAQHTVAKPGDRIPLGATNVTVVISAGMPIASMKGAGQRNPECANFQPIDNNMEDPMSVGIMVTSGKFKALHLGDNTRNKEFELACPVNRLGTVDLMLGMHHGQSSSNSPALVHAVHPRVAIVNDGTRKGGEPFTMQSLFSSPGLEDVWETHFSLLSGQEYTVPGAFIANQIDQPDTAIPVGAWTPPPQGQQAPPAPVHNGKSYFIKVTAQQDGTFSVTNTRNNFSKTYRPGDINATK